MPNPDQDEIRLNKEAQKRINARKQRLNNAAHKPTQREIELELEAQKRINARRNGHLQLPTPNPNPTTPNPNSDNYPAAKRLNFFKRKLKIKKAETTPTKPPNRSPSPGSSGAN